MNRTAVIATIVAVALVVAVGISFTGSDDDPVEVAVTAPTATAPPMTTTTASPTTTTPVPPPTECAPQGDIPAGRDGKPTTVNLPTKPTTGNVVTTVLEPGDGPAVTDASYVTVDYLGIACSTGQPFDSSWDRAEPITIAMPSATPTQTAFTVIPGWNQGLLGQQQGALVQLDIPSELAYGAQGTKGIAPNDPITFVVRIIQVKDTPPAS